MFSQVQPPNLYLLIDCFAARRSDRVGFGEEQLMLQLLNGLEDGCTKLKKRFQGLSFREQLGFLCRIDQCI